MVIICPNCNARFRIDASGIKLERFKVRCPKCSDAIVVENPPELDVPVALEEGTSLPPAAPARGTAAASANTADPQPDAATARNDDEPATDRVFGRDDDDSDRARTAEIDPSAAEEPSTEDLLGRGDAATTTLPPPGTNVRIAARRKEAEPGAGPAHPEERTKETKDTVESVRIELNERFDALMKQDYFELLAVTKEALPDEVKAAYFKLAKKYHPDRYVSQFSDEEMRRLREVSSRLNLAFNELRDPDRHKQYVLKITQPERYEKQQKANRVMEAMMQYEKGKVLFNKQNFSEALKCFEWAVELHPTEAEYHYMVGQACLRASEGVKPDYERILAALEKATELQPQTAKYHFGLGSYWKLRGETKRAMRYFKNVRELEPKHHEANREIRLYLDRKRKAEEKDSASGKLKKLFGTTKK